MTDQPRDAKKGNETYHIQVSSPLLRPGLTISTTVSKRYVVQTVSHLLDMVREINDAHGGTDGR